MNKWQIRPPAPQAQGAAVDVPNTEFVNDPLLAEVLKMD
jgi:hypothetical protein